MGFPAPLDCLAVVLKPATNGFEILWREESCFSEMFEEALRMMNMPSRI